MKPFRSDRLLAFVRTLRCSVPDCARSRRSEAAHIGPHGISQRAPDNRVVPLCDHHHCELHSIGRRTFESKYDIHLLQIADRIALRPFIFIAESHFVGRIEGEEILLCPVLLRLPEAVKRMVGFRKEQLREEPFVIAPRPPGRVEFIRRKEREA